MLRSLIYAVAVLLCFDVHAQLMPFKNYGIKDGLNDNNVQALTTDDRGLLWVGTDVSLYWFDGKKFYQPQITTNIGQLYINDFYKDHNGDIWILTFFNGLYKYHDGRFTNYLLDTLSKDAIINSISAIAQVAENRYVVISQGCSYLFDGQKFSIFDSTNKTLKRSANSVAQLANNVILVGSDEGIFLYRYENGKFLLKDHVLGDIATYKMLVTPTRLLVATRDGILTFLNSGAHTFSNPCKKYLAGKAVRDIAVGGADKIWVLSDTVFKIENEEITKYSEGNGLPESIQSMYCDKQGLIWFANRKGICMMGDEYYQFSVIRNEVDYEGVSSINIDDQGKLWIGGGNGIGVWNDGVCHFVRKVDGRPIGNVACIRKNKDGTFLMTTTSGLLSVDHNSIKKEFNIKAAQMDKNDEKNVWFGDIDGHIWLRKDKSLLPTKIDHYVQEMISCIHAVDGDLWVGYRGLGVRKYRLRKDSLILAKEYNATTGYNDMRIRSCATDNRGNIIYGTRTNGIFVFSMASDTLVAHITVQNGLNANWIKDIKCDTDGKLYLATNNGINILSGDYKNPAISHLSINNENLNRETNCILKAGNVFYIGTNEGILKWMPDNMHKDTIAPPIYFTNISIQGVKKFLVAPYTADAGEIILPDDQHVISFEFAGISLKNPDNVRYHYILEGEKNSEWSSFTGYNYVTYNLRPGNYTFKVAAENADGVWSRKPAVFHFIIKPPFWNTWWFISLILIIILLSAYGAYRYKLNQALAVELLRNNISTGLHDDIGSTLSSISILSNMALTEKSNAQMLDMINGIKENSTSLLEKMDDIVWSINPNNDTLENLIVRFRRFASVLLEAKNIEYTIDVTPAIKKLKISMNYRQHIYLILKETINNLIKYSECTRVYIGVLYENNQLDITVQDNGIGFDTETVQYGNGIINMKQRAKYMNAVIKIDSGRDAGTKICIQVKIR